MVHTMTTKAYLSPLLHWIGMISFRGIVDNNFVNVIRFYVNPKLVMFFAINFSGCFILRNYTGLYILGQHINIPLILLFICNIKAYISIVSCRNIWFRYSPLVLHFIFYKCIRTTTEYYMLQFMVKRLRIGGVHQVTMSSIIILKLFVGWIVNPTFMPITEK